MRQPIHRLVLAFATAAWALAAGVSFAQIGYQASSLEWLVADSDIVVRASVMSVARTPVVHEEDGVHRNLEVSKSVSLRVHETLKGTPAKSRAFVERTHAFDAVYEGWRDAGREQLWFLVCGEGRNEANDTDIVKIAARHPLTPRGLGPSVVRLGPPVPEEQGLSPMPPPIFTMNLDVLAAPNDILRAPRAAVAAGGKHGQVKGHAIELPRELMQRSGRSGDFNSLTVPVDKRLEKLGHRLLQSPGDFLPRLEQVYADWLRLEGVKILRHFPTDENTVLLRSMLDAPTSSIDQCPARTEANKTREAAYEVLHSWGIKVSKPVLREEPQHHGTEPSASTEDAS